MWYRVRNPSGTVEKYRCWWISKPNASINHRPILSRSIGTRLRTTRFAGIICINFFPLFLFLSFRHSLFTKDCRITKKALKLLFRLFRDRSTNLLHFYNFEQRYRWIKESRAKIALLKDTFPGKIAKVLSFFRFLSRILSTGTMSVERKMKCILRFLLAQNSESFNCI